MVTPEHEPNCAAELPAGESKANPYWCNCVVVDCSPCQLIPGNTSEMYVARNVCGTSEMYQARTDSCDLCTSPALELGASEVVYDHTKATVANPTPLADHFFFLPRDPSTAQSVLGQHDAQC